MSIASMAVRSSLRRAQDIGEAPKGVVVSAMQEEGAGKPAEGNPTDVKGSPVTELLEKLTAWIPTEAIALFLSFGGFFSVFDNTTKEIGLVVVVGILTVGYAIPASRAAQLRRSQTFSPGVAAKTAALALVAFGVWWVATPGTWLTADEHVAPFWVALALVLVVAGMPWFAKLLKVEPLRKS